MSRRGNAPASSLLNRRGLLHRPTLGQYLGLLLASIGLPAGAANCPKPTPVAEGVYYLPARSNAASPANGGRIGNSVILVGPSGVTIIDPGPTLNAGRALRCGIKKITRRPVVALINTHPHPEHVLANIAFPGAAIHASQTTADTMRQRCAQCRERLQKLIGSDNMRGTEALIPDQVVTQETAIAPGGRRLSLLPMGDAHSHGDLAVIDLATSTLISGDLGNVVNLPELLDGNVDGWIAALTSLRGRNELQRVIPGFGPPMPPAELAKPLNYLQSLRQFAEREIGKGEMLAPNVVPENLHRFGGSERAQLLNLQHAMREAENRWWATTPNADRTATEKQ